MTREGGGCLMELEGQGDGMGEETMTVKRIYRISDDAQAGNWTAERVGEDAWYVSLDGKGGFSLWMSDEKFRMMFTEREMIVDMTVEELESERLSVRENNNDKILEFYRQHDEAEGE